MIYTFLGAWDGISNAGARFYMRTGNCGRRLSRGNLALILTAGRSGWWIETGNAEPFSWALRNGIRDFAVR